MRNENSYQFEDLPNGGFRVWAKDRTPTEVMFDGRWWWVRQADDNEPDDDQEPDRVIALPYSRLNRAEEWGEKATTLLNFHLLVKIISAYLMRYWERDTNRPDFPRVHDWARERTALAISRRVHAYWQREVNKFHPDQLRVLRAVWTTTMRDHEMLYSPIFLKQAYLVSDLLRYRAARHALVGMNVTARWEPPVEAYIDMMRHWRDAFSDTNKSYPALNRTLDTLPGNIKTDRMWQLQLLHLQRAISDRLELLVTLNTTNWRAQHRHIYMHARHDDIVRAMGLVSRYLHLSLRPVRQDDVSRFSMFLNDYRETHNGNIVGLAEKAVDYHRDIAQHQVRQSTGGLPDEQETALPPVALPVDPHIRFLDTVGAVRREGEQMLHCIAGYAPFAVSGDSFLFHVDYRGEVASVEVAVAGYVSQAYGPQNTINAASRYGARMLKQWAQQLARVMDRGSVFEAPALQHPELQLEAADYEF